MARYRDKQTGRFVSKSTYKRSKAHSGTRYVREKSRPKVKSKPAARAAFRPSKRGEQMARELPRRAKLPAPPRAIRSLRDWYDEYDEADDFYNEDIGGGVDTGEEEA